MPGTANKALAARSARAWKRGGLVETARPVSQSAIWDFLRDYYTAKGIRAWAGGPVPSHATNHPRRALGYVRLVVEWIETWRRRHRLSPLEPVNVIELGAGTAQFALHFLRAWWGGSGPPIRQPVRYVLTDLAASNIEFWRRQRPLLEFAKAGRLDFARFDALAPGPLQLEHARQVLAPSASLPTVLIANYFFDSLPTDWFRFNDGQLTEWYLELAETRSGASEFHRLPEQRYVEAVVREPRYRETLLQEILREMIRRKLPGFPFPVAGLRCLDWWVRQAGGQLFAIVADKGLMHATDFLRYSNPWIQFHGSPSISLNFQAFIELCRMQGGQALVSRARGTPLETMVMAWGLGANGLARIRPAFDDIADVSNPNDLRVAALPLGKKTGRAEHALCAVRASLYDAPTFLVWAEELAKCPRRLVGELIEVIQRVVDGALPVLGPRVDLWLVCATLLMQVGEPQAALSYLETSLEQGASRWRTLWILATCYLQLNRFDDMHRARRQALSAIPRRGARRRFEELRGLFEALCRARGVRLFSGPGDELGR